MIIGTRSIETNDILGNSVFVGVSARLTGSFDDYVKKYMNSERYTEGLKPKGQVVSSGLAK